MVTRQLARLKALYEAALSEGTPAGQHGFSTYRVFNRSIAAILHMRACLVLVLAFVCVGLTGCGFVKFVHASNPYFDQKTTEGNEQLQENEMRSLAERFGLMALFAKAVYRNDMKDPGNGEGCSYLSDHLPSPTAVPTYGMPADSTGGWRRLANVVKDDAKPCVDDGGLYYETYIHETTVADPKVDVVVIAFRGTENSSTQFLADWSTNLAAVFGIEPAEYKRARRSMDHLINDLLDRYATKDKKPIIYAVGHSLGGGLAQQLGYMSKDVSTVYTFNTTPVTNWTSLRLDKDRLVRNEHPAIYRLEHGGEFLSIPRELASSMSSIRYGRYDIQVQIEPRSLFGGHAMSIFTCRFADLIAQEGNSGEVNFYPRAYAKKILMAAHLESDESNGLCVERKDSIYLSKYKPKK